MGGRPLSTLINSDTIKKTKVNVSKHSPYNKVCKFTGRLSSAQQNFPFHAQRVPWA